MHAPTGPRPAPTRRARAAALALTLAVALAACGGDDGGGDDNSSAADAAAADGAGAEAFPVTVEHAFGETVIEEAPTRVATVGWGSADAAIALGVIPVAIPFEDYGGDDEGVLPWIREAVEAEGAEMPDTIPDVDGPNIETIAAARPDLILAPYSGIDASQYELLSEVAPTVAYPDEPWATPWRQVIETVGTALGRAPEAEALLADIDAQVAEQAEAHPELEGLSVALVWDTPDGFYVYKPADARVEFTLDLGMVSAESVDALASGGETFYYELSHERLEELTSDVLVSYADTQEDSDAFLASPAAQLMDQVERGAVADVVGTELIAAVSPPTALSLTWGIDEYVASLSEAAAAARAPADG